MIGKAIDWGEMFVKWIYSLFQKNNEYKRIVKSAPHIITFIRSKVIPQKTYYFYLSDWDYITREVGGIKWVGLQAVENWINRKQECDYLVQYGLLMETDVPIQVDQGVKLGYIVLKELIDIVYK